MESQKSFISNIKILKLSNKNRDELIIDGYYQREFNLSVDFLNANKYCLLLGEEVSLIYMKEDNIKRESVSIINKSIMDVDGNFLFGADFVI